MSDVLRIIHLETERDALAARLAEAERLLRKCRDEMGRLPRSLGYDFTHTPELDKFLGAADSAEDVCYCGWTSDPACPKHGATVTAVDAPNDGDLIVGDMAYDD